MRQENMLDLRRRTELVKTEIKLQLNPTEDSDIAGLLDRMPTWELALGQDDCRKLQDELIAATQSMLKREWDKVKKESWGEVVR